MRFVFYKYNETKYRDTTSLDQIMDDIEMRSHNAYQIDADELVFIHTNNLYHISLYSFFTSDEIYFLISFIHTEK